METKSLDDLKADPNNPRILDKHDGQALSRSIDTFGDLGCIVFNVRTQQLVGGHQRLEIMKRLGDNKRIEITNRFEQPDDVGTVAIGYVYIGTKQFGYREVDWDLEKQKSANIAANRIQGRFDLDLLAQVTYEISQAENGADLLALSGQTEDEINRLLDMVGAVGDTNPADDEAPEVDTQNPPVSKLGEIYQLGNHRLMCGDSTDFGAVSDLMDGAVADMVFTDPPYNTGMTEKTNSGSTWLSHMFEDSFTPEQWQNFMVSFLENYEAVMRDGSVAYICLDWRRSHELVPNIQKYFKLTNIIVWDKIVHGLGSDYKYTYELIHVCKKGGITLETHDWSDAEYSDVWHIQRKVGKDEDHATKKPMELCERGIRHGSKRGEIVLDLFGGSGSTLIACDKLDRICYMMELDPRYVDVIRKRYAKHIGQELNWQEATPVIQEAQNAEQPAPTPKT